MTEFRLIDEQRHPATEHGEHCLLAAGAGSGKTRVLVERYLNILEAGDWMPHLPGRILAITFTEKAALEMRGRILERLVERAGSAAGDARLRLHQLLREMEAAPISTIHGFCSRLLKEHAALAGLDPRFGVPGELDLAILRAEVLDELLVEQDSDLAELSAVFDLDRVAVALEKLRELRRSLGLDPEDLAGEAADELAAAQRRGVRARLGAGLITRQAELALRESEKRYRNVVENASEAIFIAQDDVIKFSNSKAQELSGYSKEALSKTPFIEMVHPTDQAMVRDRYRKRLNGDQTPEIYSFRLLSRDQRELWVDLNVVRIEWAGKPATLNFLRYMTDKKRLDKRLQQTQRMESIGTLAGGIAHDFNNILGVIVGNTELAMEELPQWNPAYRNLEQTRKACHRAVDMVKQILSFSRRSRSELMPINITPVVKESLQLLRASTPASIEIIRNIAGDIQTILADPTQIHQVIINICTNAIHAMADESGTIEIVLKNVQIDAHMATQNPDLTPGNHVRLHVSDTGCGMDPETLNRMFEPYFTTKDVGKGTGMGLYVVLGIVRGHHGAISVQSEPGKGTVFDIFFPVVSKEAVAEPETDEAVPQGHEQVLIVDDEASLLITCREMLEKLGYGVNACADPLEALEQFKQNPAQIDLVITDMTMPRMTGERLGQELLKIRPDLPIIIATGYSKRINEESALEMGFKGLIMKPLDRRNLAKAIREALD